MQPASAIRLAGLAATVVLMLIFFLLVWQYQTHPLRLTLTVDPVKPTQSSKPAKPAKPAHRPTLPPKYKPSLEGPSRYPGVSSDGYCRTSGCKKTADNFLKMILPDADPCQDFFKFACGTFIKNRPLKPGILRTNIIWVLKEDMEETILTFLNNVPWNDTATVADKRVYNAYKLCMETGENGIAGLRDAVDAMGGPPFAAKSRPSLEKLIELTGGLSNPFYYAYAKPDKEAPEEMVYKAECIRSQSESDIARRRELVKQIAKKLAYDFGEAYFPLDDDDLERGLDSYKNFVEGLEEVRANSSEIDEGRFHPSAEVAEQYPNIPLFTFFRNGYPIFKLNRDRIALIPEQYFEDLNRYLEDHQEEAREALVIQWFLDQLPTLGNDYETIRKTYSSPYDYKPLDTYCLDKILKSHPRWKDIILLERHYRQQDFGSVHVLHEKLLAAFQEIIRESPWADAETQKNAIEKVANVEVFVGPDWTPWSRSLVDEYYRDFPATADSWYAFQQKVKHFDGFLHYNHSQEESQARPEAINDFYSLRFHWALLTPPLYHVDAALELQYGALGFIIAHEIAHTIDPGWINRDTQVLAGDEDEGQFAEQVECIDHQYGNATFPIVSSNHTFRQPGNQTHEETVADNAAVRAAFRAYRNERRRLYGRVEPKLPGLDAYTPDQLYFVAAAMFHCGEHSDGDLEGYMADEHPIGYIRVNEMMKNSKDFSRAYKCPLNSPMNPEKKCRVWRHKKI